MPRVSGTIKFIFALLIIIAFWWNFTHYVDFGSGCYLKISTGLEFNNTTIKNGLKALKYAVPTTYRMVCRDVTVIRTGVSCGGFGGGCYHGGSRSEIYVSVAQGAVLESAAIIAHELCHLYQDRDGKPFDENECYLVDDAVLREMAKF
ncbi:MAG: hypothetical protein A3G59_00425 [Candidatus Taylorbacteria bacterium RIFCSPLOWO2_12_FULL_47_20]|uniref:Uncharacterized protein n=2 Tax=Candidatus Tayloriibacteriota TaxID=1817919 RepID=A0A1G2P9N0_9BACT|nr:MAG: hypothetical protein A3H68_03400 [Candidatus Taylorbacteria bacterium RIFCSPLOWO2_02_FULL_46_40]OHA45037.1 MAG: hypothetical protein A3G59_00425 [Candidatus Taylorbacteria bacterium RIFCSPLOWO2_12_FULL_47_20]